MSLKETTKSTFEKPFSDRWVLKHIRESPIRMVLTQLWICAPDSHKKLDEELSATILQVDLDLDL